MNDPSLPTINKLPAARGLAWLAGSWELIRRQPIRLLLISLFFQFFLSFSQADLLGLLVVMCLPALSAGMLHALHLVESGRTPMLAVLFMPFTAKISISRLLLLGGVVLVLSLLLISMSLAGQVMDVDPQVLSRIEQGDLEALQQIDPNVMENTLMTMALAAAIGGMLTYFSVPLIWFRKLSLARALLLGLRAMGRNWRPLLLIGCLLGLLAVPIALLFGSFYLSALTEGGGSTWLAFLLLLLGPFFQLLLFGAQYLAFRDIFGLDDQPEGTDDAGGDQLVA